MIFCLPALASLSGKQPYSATFRASWLARSAHTESKALLSSCNFTKPQYNSTSTFCSRVIVFGGKARGDTEREF